MIIILLLLIGWLFPKGAYANDLSVVCNSSECKLTGNDWNLNADKIVPGWIEYENFKISNTRKEGCEIRMNVFPEGEFMPLGGKIMLSLREEEEVVFAGHLSDLLESYKDIGFVGAKNTNNWIMALSLDQDADNSVKNKSANFGFNINFTCEPVERVINPEEGIIINEYMPYPLVNNKEWIEIKNNNDYPVDLNNWTIYDSGNNKTKFSISLEAGEIAIVENNNQFLNNDNGDSVRLLTNNNQLMDWSSYTKATQGLSFSRQDDGNFCITDESKGLKNLTCKSIATGGEVLGQTMSSPPQINSTPVCSEEAPSSPPQSLTARTGVNSVTLEWTEGGGPFNYYLIAYGDDSRAEDYGNPNIGGQGTNSYTVLGLSADKTYYFKVRSGNGCMPGSFSNTVAIRPTGSALTTEILPSGFQEGVLGVSTEKTDESEPRKDDQINDNGQGGKVLGTEDILSKGKWWWLVLLGLVCIRIIFFVIKDRSRQ